MSSIAESLDQAFDASLPRRLQEALLRCVFTTYRVAFAECERFNPEEAHDLRPFYRWVKLRDEVRGLPDVFDNLAVEVEPNGSPSSYHVVITCGQIMLTASALDNSKSLPRPSAHRNAYSYQNQGDFFIADRPPPPENGLFYGILVHGPDQSDSRNPAFAKVIFPDKDYESAVHEINLFRRFSELVKELRVPTEEVGNRRTEVARFEDRLSKKEKK